MIVDHRTYTVRAGTLRRQLALYDQHGLAVQSRHLGPPIAFLVPETGELNTYVHMWAFKDFADREARRASLDKDEAWQAYFAKAFEAGYIVKQETKLMTLVEFTNGPSRLQACFSAES